MNHSQGYGYGLWAMAIVQSALFILFAMSFVKPKSKTDWRSLGAFSAFILALFTEMYGFPLTIYLFSGWLARRFPGVDLLSHDSGHLLHDLLGLKGNPHFDVLHLASNLLIVAGFFLLSSAWRVLYEAQRHGRLAVEGPYRRVRHPQYVAFVVIMFGFLLQWPTLPTVLMFPVLVFVYARLARREERDSIAAFGDDYLRYQENVPAFFPHVFRQSETRQTGKREMISGPREKGDVCITTRSR